MIEVLASIFLLAGSVFMLLAALGLLRLPDLYTRIHAATKAASLGMLLLISGLCLYYFSIALVLKSIFIILFIFSTVPVAAHLIAGTGHLMKVKKWKGTLWDEWEEERIESKTGEKSKKVH